MEQFIRGGLLVVGVEMKNNSCVCLVRLITFEDWMLRLKGECLLLLVLRAAGFPLRLGGWLVSLFFADFFP